MWIVDAMLCGTLGEPIGPSAAMHTALSAVVSPELASRGVGQPA